jgi:hypothetical protein
MLFGKLYLPVKSVAPFFSPWDQVRTSYYGVKFSVSDSVFSLLSHREGNIFITVTMNDQSRDCNLLKGNGRLVILHVVTKSDTGRVSCNGLHHSFYDIFGSPPERIYHY